MNAVIHIAFATVCGGYIYWMGKVDADLATIKRVQLRILRHLELSPQSGKDVR